ncbi:Uncharacterised protein [Mycobacteroides abscessus subsp. abscessus]|nr:Uncharacterised protein [Mycobacteroides abscessus subsp. abscessus]
MDASTWPIQPVTRRWTTGVLQETDPLSRRAESIYGCASEVAWPDDFPLRATGPVHGAPVNTGRLPDALSVLSPGRATMAITDFCVNTVRPGQRGSEGYSWISRAPLPQTPA